MFNPHSNLTADGVVIVPNMHVWTNEVEAGRVISDRTSGMCCGEPATPGQTRISGAYFTDHGYECPRVGNDTEVTACYCRHNHWFDVQYADGSVKMFDGERLAVRTAVANYRDPEVAYKSAKESNA